MHYLTRRPDEILTDVTIPRSTGWRSAYWKLRRRGSFDFPVRRRPRSRCAWTATVVEARIVLGAVASRPLARRPRPARCSPVSARRDDVIAAAADAAHDLAKPMDNTDFELVWRKKMVRALVTVRAARNARRRHARELRLRIARQTLT